MAQRFRDLTIGQTFDFINDDKPSTNSFFDRCTKTSARMYSWKAASGMTYSTRVGTINVDVYHVEPSVYADLPFAEDFEVR